MPRYKKCKAEECFLLGKLRGHHPPLWLEKRPEEKQIPVSGVTGILYGARSEGSVTVTAKDSQCPGSWGVDNVIPDLIRQGRNFLLFWADTSLVHLNFTAPERHINLQLKLPHFQFIVIHVVGCKRGCWSDILVKCSCSFLTVSFAEIRSSCKRQDILGNKFPCSVNSCCSWISKRAPSIAVPWYL